MWLLKKSITLKGAARQQFINCEYLAHYARTISPESQAMPFAERGRVWSHCNYQVVAEKCNY